MKQLPFTFLLIILLSASSLKAAQRFTAINAKTNYTGFECSYRDLELKTDSSKKNMPSYMVGLMHKGAGENRVYSEHIGFINWEGSDDDFGIYSRVTFMYRNKIPNPYTNHDLILSAGITANFEFGFFGTEIYTFGQVGPILGLIYQIPEKGFSFYTTAIFEFIILSQIGETNLDYRANPFFGIGFGVEYLLSDTDINFGIEGTFIREFSIVFLLGKRI
ncbi:MAG: hypothetical protein K8S87_04250 [Planctomycetes bacterium]|nr:hypothetical protein [Planctomycetota bacterium]